MSARFQKNLEKGIAAEDIVHGYLKMNNRWVQDCRAQKHDKKSGPKLEGTEGTLVLPDFICYNKKPKESYAVDVKAKSAIYPIDGKNYFTVDNKFEQYKRVVELFGLDWLKIIFYYEGRMYLYRCDEYSLTKEFNNRYSIGKCYLFEFDRSKMIY